MSFAVDANILLHGSDRASPFHEPARRFIEQCAGGDELLYLAWPTVMAYLRIATHPSIFERPLSLTDAMDNIDSLLSLPHVRVLDEGEGFWSSYRTVADEVLPRGNLVPDTHLAVILRQHGVSVIYTRDRDFRRFDFLKAIDPLAA